MPQFSYTFPPAQLGQIGTFGWENIDSLANPLRSQINTITVADNDAGTYSVTITAPEGEFVTSRPVVAQSIAQIADELADAINDNEDLLNIVSAESDGVSVITLTFLHAGVSYTVAVSSASADLVLALSQSAGGSNFPLGIGVVDAGDKTARLPQSGDVALDILGIVCNRGDVELPFQTGFDSSAQLVPGAELAVLRQGEIWVRPETAVSVNDPVYCRVVATGSEQAGALRNDADGGDAVQLSARFRTAASAGGLAKIQIDTP